MAIVYHGRIKELSEDLESVKPILDARYEEILGKEKARKLNEVSDKVLSPACFFDTAEDFYKGLGEKLPENSCNRMIFGSSGAAGIHSNGKINGSKLKTTVAFYISENGFNNSGSSEFTERHLASYVHEFDHFVWYALHKTPIYLMSNFLMEAQEPMPKNPSDLDGYVKDMIEAKVDANKMGLNLNLSVIRSVFIETYEKANRILDKLVLESIGINVPLPWRNTKSSPHFIESPSGLCIVMRGGDQFRTFSDQEAIEKFLDWEDNLGRIFAKGTGPSIDFIRKLYSSLISLEVDRIPLEEIKFTQFIDFK